MSTNLIARLRELGIRRTKYTEPWLKALRGDKYKQGKGYLEADGKFCCMGVANVVCKFGDTNNRGLSVTNTAKLFGVTNFRTGGYLVDYPISQEIQCVLASANDGSRGHAKLSFATIADAIEAAVNEGDKNG